MAGTRITSTMQDDFPLTITTILRHGARVFGRSECVTWQGDGARHTSYRQIEENARRLASALTRLGVGSGDPVATFCWNNQEHLEAYYAVPCMGAVVHTLNIRLPAHQLVHIVNDAQDKIIIVDGSLLPLLAPVAGSFTSVEAYIVIGEGDTSVLGDRPVYSYDELLAAEEPSFVWPELDERSAAAMCYTSGTTGDPRGVVYSHRSTYLHAVSTLQSACVGSSEADRQLTIVPMFHVNAWGIPFAAFMSGTTMHMPGKYMTPAALVDFIEAERTTLASAVPTIWAGILQVGAQREIDLSSLRMGTSGGAAMPRSLMEAFQKQYGVHDHPGLGDDRDVPGRRAGPAARRASSPGPSRRWTTG